MSDARTHVDKAEYRRLLDEICEDYCEKERYCLLKLFLTEAHPSRRLLVQMKCIEKFKFERSKRAEKDIGWDQAYKEWMEEGFAKAFGDCYSDDKALRELYAATMKLQAEQSKKAS